MEKFSDKYIKDWNELAKKEGIITGVSGGSMTGGFGGGCVYCNSSGL